MYENVRLVVEWVFARCALFGRALTGDGQIYARERLNPKNGNQPSGDDRTRKLFSSTRAVINGRITDNINVICGGIIQENCSQRKL